MFPNSRAEIPHWGKTLIFDISCLISGSSFIVWKSYWVFVVVGHSFKICVLIAKRCSWVWIFEVYIRVLVYLVQAACDIFDSLLISFYIICCCTDEHDRVVMHANDQVNFDCHCLFSAGSSSRAAQATRGAGNSRWHFCASFYFPIAMPHHLVKNKYILLITCWWRGWGFIFLVLSLKKYKFILNTFKNYPVKVTI